VVNYLLIAPSETIKRPALPNWLLDFESRCKFLTWVLGTGPGRAGSEPRGVGRAGSTGMIRRGRLSKIGISR
jgi:hypothetical protein